MSDLRASLGDPGPIVEHTTMLKHGIVLGVLFRLDTQTFVLHVSTSNRSDDLSKIVLQIPGSVLHVLPGTEEPEGFDGRLVIIDPPQVDMSEGAKLRMERLCPSEQRAVHSLRAAFCLASLLDKISISPGPLTQTALEQARSRTGIYGPLRPMIEESLHLLMDYIELVVRWPAPITMAQA